MSPALEANIQKLGKSAYAQYLVRLLAETKVGN